VDEEGGHNDNPDVERLETLAGAMAQRLEYADIVPVAEPSFGGMVCETESATYGTDAGTHEQGYEHDTSYAANDTTHGMPAVTDSRTHDTQTQNLMQRLRWAEDALDAQVDALTLAAAEHQATRDTLLLPVTIIDVFAASPVVSGVNVERLARRCVERGEASIMPTLERLRDIYEPLAKLPAVLEAVGRSHIKIANKDVGYAVGIARNMVPRARPYDRVAAAIVILGDVLLAWGFGLGSDLVDELWRDLERILGRS
jgi:hypothetical protein